MNRKDFSKILNGRVRACKNILEHKADVYAAGSDRLSNFKDAGRLLSCSPERALQGFMTKHIVALNDFIAKLDYAQHTLMGEWEEKIGDIINYLILLEALVKERYPKINISSGRIPAAGPAPTKKKSVETLQSPDSPTGNSLITTELPDAPELPGMSQKVHDMSKDISGGFCARTNLIPGTPDTKHWKDAMTAPIVGAQARISDIGIFDAYYARKEEFIGMKGLVIVMTSDKHNAGWFYGELAVDGEKELSFSAVKLQILV